MADKYEESLKHIDDKDKDTDLGSDEDEVQDWEDWEEEEEDGDDSDSSFLCLFCDSTFADTSSLFAHCTSTHHFDFHAIRRSLRLDFYDSFKLINFVRSQVSPGT